MTDFNAVIEGTVKFRDGKKWKSRWCVMRKLSPVADCLHLQLYRDSKDRYKHGQTKASLSLQHFLGVESGFTLDKESNTVAIICQDVTVVLAFDTRERLIQWQVKISANLGDDQQFLIQIASCPPKSKISAGPARMHVQDLRFSMTTGVPPRLAGVWELRHLRKYGVIENRFCYEGGSRCGKGEGLFVCFTDQGDEITRCMNLAAEGKLATRKRLLARNMSVLESPSRRGGLLSRLDSRTSEYGGDGSSFGQHNSHDRSNEENVCWPSSESRLDNSDFGDTASVGDFQDANLQECTWTPETALERCASCISKLGALSRSSTMANTPGSVGFNPAWTMDNNVSTLNYIPEISNGHQCCGYVSSQSSSSGGSGSMCGTEYSVPRKVSSTATNDKTNKSQPETCTAATMPTRPPKPVHMKPETSTPIKKAPMPLPLQPETSTCTCRCSSAVDRPKLQPQQHYLNNYDTPKTVASKHNNKPYPTTQDEYYDTPRKIKSVLEVNPYGNYDTPPSPVAVHKKNYVVPALKHQDSHCNHVCPCQKSMTCWPNDRMAIPPCRRSNHNNSMSNNYKAAHHCQVNNNAAIYATVDVSKKKKHAEPTEKCTNYMNLEPPAQSIMTTTADRRAAENYMNLEFSESLCHYENAKNVLTKAGMAPVAAASSGPCDKCGHHNKGRDESGCGGDYMTMEPVNGRMVEAKRNLFPGYLPMSPATAQRDMLKNVLNKGLAEKSASIPSLNEYKSDGTPVNKTLNRVDEPRKRSSSAGSSTTVSSNRYDDYDEEDDDVERENLSAAATAEQPSSGRTSVNTSSAESVTSQIVKCPGGASRDDQQAAVLVHIRRSSSVPCKNNRDSSSSNDSGVSTGSLRYRGAEFAEFELPLTTAMSTMRHKQTVAGDKASSYGNGGCVHGSLPRRSKSTERLKELSFRFQKVNGPMKSSSAGAEVPVCMKKDKGCSVHAEGNTTVPFLDSQSTSSCTSDMSDYIETLSLSSHSSSDTNNENLKFGRPATKTTLKPRSGKEYHQIGYFLDSDLKIKSDIPPVPEKSEPHAI
ncbi:uncharacterized protein LOC126836042 isoform X2 [Adelges cooleyi]|uniref:uncharacterized protein LOC126836042 isoform X2 n=1 Tax=Adelges cooleyi TaxID=133065 RepID=UPI00217F7C3C|nr:uncharacterized protein LOC126836042 isoform X2 [Adelges cooleyi]